LGIGGNVFAVLSNVLLYEAPGPVAPGLRGDGDMMGRPRECTREQRGKLAERACFWVSVAIAIAYIVWCAIAFAPLAVHQASCSFSCVSRFVFGAVRIWGTHACGVDGAPEYEMIINGSYPGCAPLASRTDRACSL